MFLFRWNLWCWLRQYQGCSLFLSWHDPSTSSFLQRSLCNIGDFDRTRSSTHYQTKSRKDTLSIFRKMTRSTGSETATSKFKRLRRFLSQPSVHRHRRRKGRIHAKKTVSSNVLGTHCHYRNGPFENIMQSELTRQYWLSQLVGVSLGSISLASKERPHSISVSTHQCSLPFRR